MMPQETSMQGAGMGAGGRLDQAATLLAHARELLDDQRHQRGLGSGTNGAPGAPKQTMQTEIRTLEFWRAIIAECVATFFLLVMICSVHQSLGAETQLQIYSALATGLGVLTLCHSFMPVSGAHLNPAVSIACVVTKRISMLRAALYVCAQCGGAIAGAALVYGIHGAHDQFEEASVANFGLEFILTFVVVFTYFSATNPHRLTKSLDPGVTVGLAYMAALTCYKGALNPARALGPAFVVNQFTYHWVFWVGPILGGVCGAFCFQFIFNVQRPKASIKDMEANMSMVNNSEEDMIDDLERVKQYRSNMMQTYNETGASLFNSSVKPYKRPLDTDSVYGGTKSLYAGQAGRSTTPYQADCSKSVYAGELSSREEDFLRSRGGVRSSLRRSQSTKMLRSSDRRNPYDHLPDAPEKMGGTMGRHGPSRGDYQESFGPDPAYSEYIRRKNAAADQCSGSSSGYYSSSKEQERPEIYDGYEMKEEKRRRGPLRDDFRGPGGLRRERSLTRDFRDGGPPRGPRGPPMGPPGPDFLPPRPHGGPTPPIGPPGPPY